MRPEFLSLECWLNGDFRPLASCHIGVNDTVVVGGSRIVDAIRVVGTQLMKPDHCFDRMADQVDQLGGDIPPRRQLLEIASELVARNSKHLDNKHWRIEFTTSLGPERIFGLYPDQEPQTTLLVRCIPLTRRLASLVDSYHDGVSVVTPEQPAIPSQYIPPQLKSRGGLQWQRARVQCGPGVWPVLLDEENCFTEGPGWNFFAVYPDGAVHTSPRTNVVNGLVRSEVIAMARSQGLKVVEGGVPVSDSSEFVEAFITSSTWIILPVNRINGANVSEPGQPWGSVGCMLRKMFNEQWETKVIKDAEDCAVRVRNWDQATESADSC